MADVAIDSDSANIVAMNGTEQGSVPATPAAGHRKLYASTRGWLDLASSGVKRLLGWGPSHFNVRDYGAVGDGTTDDTTAINLAIAALNSAANGILYFPSGTYKVTAGTLTTITANGVVRGEGRANFDELSASGSLITSPSATAVLLTVTGYNVRFEHLGLVNTSGTTPSAGAAIQASSANALASVSYHSVSIQGFWIGVDSQVGTGWGMEDCRFLNQIKYSVKVQNTVNADFGDWTIHQAMFYATHTADAAIRIESSGGGRITDCKINQAGSSSRYTYGIDLVGGAGTSDLFIGNCSLENVTTSAIHTSGTWPNIIISACEVNLGTTNNTAAIAMTGATYFVITGCVLTAPSSTLAAVVLTSCDHGSLSALEQTGFAALLTLTTCTNITDTTSAYTLPAATTGARGGVRPDGTTITIAGDIISAVGGGGGGSFAGARYKTAAGQSISAATLTIVNFDTVDFDTASAVTTGASWHYTAPTTGHYQILAAVTFDIGTFAAGSVLLLQLFKNGSLASNLARFAVEVSSTSGYCELVGQDLLALTAGDTVDLRIYQGSSGAQVIYANAAYNYVAILSLS